MPEGFSIDSYPKPNQQSTVDVFKGYQQLESNKLGIDKQKLDLVNQHMNNLVREFQTAPPNATYEDMQDIGQRAVNMKTITPDQFKEYIRNMPTDPAKINAYKDQQIQRLLSTQEALNWYHGHSPQMQDVGGGQQPVQNFQGQIRATGPVVPSGLPATTPGFQKATPDFPQGRVAPIGPAQSPGLPIAGAPQPAPIQPRPVPTTNIGPLNRLGATPPGAPGQSFNSRFSGEPITPGAPPPGFEQAAEQTGGSSGKMLAADREAAATYNARTFPLQQAIPLMEKLGTKGTGPGTETINHIKSFLLSNAPWVTEKQLSDVNSYDKANKYMVDYVNRTGSTGTNDKLAAAFAGNPSVHISNAAATDVLKSALSLEKMRNAQLVEFRKQKLPDNQYADWAARWNHEQDARAFGFDLMSADKQKKMLEGMKPDELTNFKKSLRIAHEAKVLDTVK